MLVVPYAPKIESILVDQYWLEQGRFTILPFCFKRVHRGRKTVERVANEPGFESFDDDGIADAKFMLKPVCTLPVTRSLIITRSQVGILVHIELK